MTVKQARMQAKSMLSDKRFQHTVNVKKMAVKLAEIYGEDPDKAALAAYLHDCAKELPREELLRILRDNAIMAENAETRPAPVWHGVCAAILARTQWGVTDEDVLSAVACHTAGKPNMTNLDKILFLADMTSAERSWPGVQKLRRLERKNLDDAMMEALQQTIGYVRKGGKPVDPLSAAAYQDLAEKHGRGKLTV